jgi:uncharacterized protein
MKERTKLLLILGVFAVLWFLPVGSERFWSAIHESFSLVRWYAREHVLLCLVPAFFIAGAVSVFVSQGAVLKYLGPKAKKLVAYPVAARRQIGSSRPTGRAPTASTPAFPTSSSCSS